MQSPSEAETLEQDERVQAHVWTFNAIGELIASAPSLPEPPRRENLVRGLRRSLRNVTGSCRALARQLGVSDTTLASWQKGRSIPSLWCLLLVSSRLGITLVQLAHDEVGDLGRTAERNATPQARPNRPPRVRTAIGTEAVRGTLEAILASGEMPPPSLREVAERIGQTYTNLRHHLPELSRLISARYRSYQEAQGAGTRTRLRDEIRQAAIQLHRQGNYPSNNRIADLISNPSALRSLAGQSAGNEVLHELGWRS